LLNFWAVPAFIELRSAPSVGTLPIGQT
jgi:hypothetical protein